MQTEREKNKLRRNCRALLLFPGILLVLVCCAPKVTERVYEQGQTQFGPLQSDPDLGLGDSTSGQNKPIEFNFPDRFNSARFFNGAAGLIEYGELANNTAISRLGVQLGLDFYKGENTTAKVSFERSPYVLAAIGETKADSLKDIDSQAGLLKRQGLEIASLLKATSSQFAWPTGSPSSDALFASLRSYLQFFLNAASRKGIDPRIVRALRNKIIGALLPMLASAQKDVSLALSDPDPLGSIQELQQAFKTYKIDLDPATSARLEAIVQILQETKKIATPQDALTILIELWDLLTPAERAQTFQPVSQELYDFFNSVDAGNLDCLKDSICVVIPLEIIKRVKILPAITDFGLEKLRDRLLSGIHESVNNQVLINATRKIQTVPDLIEEDVQLELSALENLLQQIRTNYAGFVEDFAQRFAETSDMLPAGAGRALNGLEPTYVNVKPLGNARFSIRGLIDDKILESTEFVRQRRSRAKNLAGEPNSNSPTNEPDAKPGTKRRTGAAVLGASMRFALISQTKNDRADWAREQILEQLSKLLAIGGYKEESGRITPSLARSIAPNEPVVHLDLRNFRSAQKSSITVPDQVMVGNGFTGVDLRSVDVSAADQADLLSGLSSMVRLTRDWEKTPFDDLLGYLKVEQFVPSLPSGSLDQAFFPKDVLFALSLANSAVLLQNLTRSLSSVFLIDLDRKTFWASELGAHDGAPAATAAVVDIKAGVRQSLVRSSDVAKTLLSLTDILQATEGIEHTQSELLLEPGQGGKTAVQEFIEARAQLRLLVMALANFLSHEVQAKDGGIYPHFDAKTVRTVADEKRTLEDQALSILALEQASNYLKVDIYRWAALDIYAFMNRSLYSRTRGFYFQVEDQSGASPVKGEHDDSGYDLTTASEALLAGQTLRSFMEPRSQAQWDKISLPLVLALQRL